MTQGVLKVGIMGFGYASLTFHAPLIMATPGLELVAVSSSDAAKVQMVLPHMPVFANPQEMLLSADLDIVVIPTPNETHFELAQMALAAGKHVVVDKPFTLNSTEAKLLIDQAEKAQLLLSVFHNRRWDADFLTLQQLIEQNTLGRIVHFESHFDRFRPQVRQRWRESDQLGAGLWYDLGSHLLDQSLQLFGSPQSIYLDTAMQRDQSQAVDWFHAILQYQELRVVLHASALVAQTGPRLVVHGTKGSYTKMGLDIQEDQLKAGIAVGSETWGIDPVKSQLCLAHGDWLAQSEHNTLPGQYQAYYQGIYNAIVLGATNPVAAQDALKVIELIEAGTESARTGQKIMLPT